MQAPQQNPTNVGVSVNCHFQTVQDVLRDRLAPLRRHWIVRVPVAVAGGDLMPCHRDPVDAAGTLPSTAQDPSAGVAKRGVMRSSTTAALVIAPAALLRRLSLSRPTSRAGVVLPRVGLLHSGAVLHDRGEERQRHDDAEEQEKTADHVASPS